MVECKLGDGAVDRNLKHLKAKYPDCAAWQVSATGTRDYQTAEGIRVCPALELLRQLA